MFRAERQPPYSEACESVWNSSISDLFGPVVCCTAAWSRYHTSTPLGMDTYVFHIFKLNNLKFIYDLYSIEPYQNDFTILGFVDPTGLNSNYLSMTVSDGPSTVQHIPPSVFEEHGTVDKFQCSSKSLISLGQPGKQYQLLRFFRDSLTRHF